VNSEIVKPSGLAITKRYKAVVYQHDVTALFTGNGMIFGLTQLLEIASCRPDCVIYSQP
jgi:hypothetical protein